MNYEEKTSIGTPDNGFGVYSPQTERCAIRISKLFGRWSDSILRVAGWCKGIFVRGLRRPNATKPARACDGVHTRSKVKGKKLWYIHVITFASMAVFIPCVVFSGFIPAVAKVILIVPLGLFTAWCMLVSFVRIMQGVTGCTDLDKMGNNIEKDNE